MAHPESPSIPQTPADTPVLEADCPQAPGAAADCPQPRMRADARRNRAKIIDAARKVFAETGRLTQMDDVAAAAGVGVGTVYRHFPTKDELLGELLVQKFEMILGYLREARAAGGDPGEDLLECLARCAEQVESDAATQHALSGPQSSAVWKAAAPTVQQVDQLAGELIREGVASGTLRSDMQVTDIRLLMCGVAATMADPDLRGMWRRHMTLLVDSLRPPRGERDDRP